MSEAILRQQESSAFRAETYKFLRFSECYLDIEEDGSANVMVTLKALKGVDRLSATVYLQRFDGDWTTIKTWETKNKGNYLSFFENKKVQKGIGYRIQVYSYADKGAYSECLVSEYGKVF